MLNTVVHIVTTWWRVKYEIHIFKLCWRL